MSNDGELVSHIEFKKKLDRLAKKKKIYLITATHDWCCDENPRKFDGDTVSNDVETMPSFKLYPFYEEYTIIDLRKYKAPKNFDKNKNGNIPPYVTTDKKAVKSKDIAAYLDVDSIHTVKTAQIKHGYEKVDIHRRHNPHRRQIQQPKRNDITRKKHPKFKLSGAFVTHHLKVCQFSFSL